MAFPFAVGTRASRFSRAQNSWVFFFFFSDEPKEILHSSLI